MIAALIMSLPARAARWPTTKAAARWHPPRGWLTDALCIHRHESVLWHRAWTDWQGQPSPYAGGFEFLQSTWASVGGAGEPWQWSAREQLFRAWRVWARDGGSWREWGSAGVCRLR